MCYPCTQCGSCGKYDKDSPVYQPAPELLCFTCGAKVDLRTGICTDCGKVAFAPTGTRAVERAD